MGRIQLLPFLLGSSWALSLFDRQPPVGLPADSTKNIGKVVDTLQAIFDTITNEEIEEAKTYTAFSQWCMNQSSDLPSSIKDTEMKREQAKGEVVEIQADVAQLEQVIADIGRELQDAQDSVDQANNLRKEDNEKYIEDSQMNMQSLDQVKKAIEILGQVTNPSPNFLQVNAESRSSEPGESSMVLGIMKGLEDRLTVTRNNMDAAEKEAQEHHDQLIGTESARISNLQNLGQAKRLERTSQMVELVQTQRMEQQMAAELEKLSRALTQVKAQCDEKAKWWEARREDRVQEKTALQEAIKYLQTIETKGTAFLSFLQQASAEDSGVGGRGEDAAAIGHFDGGNRQAWLSAATAQMLALQVTASTSSRRNMDSAKKVVSQLIEVLQKEQQSEAKQKKYCEAELQQKGDEQNDLNEQLKSIQADIDSKTSEAALLERESKDIDAELEKSKEALEGAALIRKKDKQIYEDSSKDRELALKVLQQARTILENFYKTKDGTALMQREARQPGVPPTGSSRKDVQAGIAVAMLEKIVDDIRREQKNADVEESASAAVFDKMVIENREEFDDQMQAITERVKARATMLVRLGTAKESKTQKSEDQIAVSKQLDSLHSECDELLAFFERRTKARDFEVSQLRDVFDILSGSQLAVRTGFSQQTPRISGENEATMDARELSLLHDLSNAAFGVRDASVDVEK